MHSDVLGVVRVSDGVTERPSSFCTLVNIIHLCNHEIIVSLLTLSLDPVPCIGTILRGMRPWSSTSHRALHGALMKDRVTLTTPGPSV